MSETTQEIRDGIGARLDKVSPSFCLAKWLQVTLHLHNGTAHSCHHPYTHKIPLESLTNPAALHNTLFKKERRREMLEGVRHNECNYCWKIEEGGGKSDRFIKSSDPWAQDLLEEVAKSPWDADWAPTYLEVSFSTICNLKCSYCSPQVSSLIQKEYEAMGDYPTRVTSYSLEALRAENRLPLAEETNPYIEAFWRWWPEVYPKLRVLRITGGEPLLSPNTFRVLDEIKKNPRPDLEFAVNSNLMVPRKRLLEFVQQVQELRSKGKIGKFDLFTSIDAWGTRAEYIRTGLRHDYFWENVDLVLRELPGVNLVFMVTFNAMSVTSFEPLLTHVARLRKDHPAIHFDISHLNNPQHQSAKVLPAHFIPLVESHLRFMKQDPSAFFASDVAKLERILNWMSRPEHPYWLADSRADFYRHFSEHDRRRGTSFLKTFPEMADFWAQCRYLAMRSQYHTAKPSATKARPNDESIAERAP